MSSPTSRRTTTEANVFASLGLIDRPRHRFLATIAELSKLLRELGFVEVEGRSVLAGTVRFHRARKPGDSAAAARS